jgi:hypothetical protein
MKDNITPTFGVQFWNSCIVKSDSSSAVSYCSSCCHDSTLLSVNLYHKIQLMLNVNIILLLNNNDDDIIIIIIIIINSKCNIKPLWHITLFNWMDCDTKLRETDKNCKNYMIEMKCVIPE